MTMLLFQCVFRLCDLNLASQYLPIDLYIGGVEHATMHLLYARFMSKFLRDQGFLGDEGQMRDGEPFKRLLAQVSILSDLYYCQTLNNVP